MKSDTALKGMCVEASAILIFWLANIITTFLLLLNLANSSVCPVKGIPPALITSLLIGQVTIALNSFEIVFFTDSSKILIMYSADLGSGLPAEISVPMGLLTIQRKSLDKEASSSPLYSFIAIS